MSRIFNLSLSHIFSGCSRNSRLRSKVKLLSNTKKMTSGTSRGAHVYTFSRILVTHCYTKDVFLLVGVVITPHCDQSPIFVQKLNWDPI